MSIRDIGQCRPCCKQDPSCDKCNQKCLPRYLCVNAKIIKDPYDTSCHCESIDARLFPSVDCGWFSVISCESDSLTIRVSLEKEYGTDTCNTRVTIDELEFDDVFEGILKDLHVEGVDSTTGVSYEIDIGPASMIENPRSFDRCPLCKCATCLPNAFCLILTDADGNLYTGTANWSCTSEDYTATIARRNIRIRLATAEDGLGCALIVTGDAGLAVIELEAGDAAENAAMGISCLEGGGIVTRGKNPFQPIDLPGVLEATIQIYDDGVFYGTLVVREKSCDGTCSACINKPNHGLCCDYLPPTLTMHVRCTSDASVPCDDSQTQTVSWAGGYTGTFTFCDLPPGITIVADCEDDLVTQSEWTLSLTIPTVGGSSKRLANAIPCPGILLIATFTQARDYGPPIGIVTYTFEITVTL